MFMGLYEHTMDAKNRLSLPSKLRSGLYKGKKREIILTRGFENCLFIYPIKTWEEISAKFKNLSFPNNKANEYRAFLRIFFSGAVSVDIDSSGRILIPQAHSSFANIKKDIISVGMVDRIEIWSKEVWNKYKKDAEKVFDKVVDKIY